MTSIPGYFPSQIPAPPARSGEDLSRLKASFPGPPGTPYEGGTFVVDIKIPEEYPFRWTTFEFESKLRRPNTSNATEVRKSYEAEESASDDFVPLSDLGRRKISRQNACDYCRTRKFKCYSDGRSPCKGCSYAGVDCSLATKKTYSIDETPSPRAMTKKGTPSWTAEEEQQRSDSDPGKAGEDSESRSLLQNPSKMSRSSEVGIDIVDALTEFETLKSRQEILQIRQNILQTQQETLESFKVRNGKTKYSKIKRGLSGFINASRVSAIADTGSAQNVISAAYASNLKLPIEYSSNSFQLGNSKTIKSIGTVKLHWAFAEDPAKKYDLLFHVLPTCLYDVILGSAFLTATETLSNYGRRLTECVFSIARVFKFGFLGNRCHRLEGVLDDKYPVLAVPDTGAERNVMDAWYAKSQGFEIDTRPGTQNVLQFADGSCQETIGQVTASWTFTSGEKALLTFEVLEDCASEVVLGEDFIFEHNIFAKHGSSLRVLEFDGDSHELAPFDFISSWQQKYLNVKSKLQNNNAADITSPQKSPVSMAADNERLRRDIWNHKFEFGSKASPEEIQAETKRKEDYETSLKKEHSVPQNGHFPRIPSIPTSFSGASQSNRAVTANIPNFSRPHAR